MTGATCFTHAHRPVIWNPQLVVLVVRSVGRSVYCISFARYPGMRKSRPVKDQDNQESKVWPPSPLCTLSRLSGFVFRTFYRAIPSYEVVEKCVPGGVLKLATEARLGGLFVTGSGSPFGVGWLWTFE